MGTGPVLPFSTNRQYKFQDATCDAEIALEVMTVASEKQIQSPNSSVYDLKGRKDSFSKGRKTIQILQMNQPANQPTQGSLTNWRALPLMKCQECFWRKRDNRGPISSTQHFLAVSNNCGSIEGLKEEEAGR